MTVEIAVLVSVGRHPVSGRGRRAPGDAQALELGLRVAEAAGARLHVLHAGDPEAPALRDYLGMGVGELHVLALPEHADAVPALAERLRALHPALVLTGARSEAGWSSGCVPYALAAALNFAVVPAAASLTVGDAAAQVQQALPRGRRRALQVTLPAVLAVDAAAPTARSVAYARARRGRIVVEQVQRSLFQAAEPGTPQPSRVRPPRLQVEQGASAAERLQALTTRGTGSARIVHPNSASEAAREIHNLLLQRGLVQPGG